MYKKLFFVLFISVLLLLQIILGAITCSDYWGDCSSRTQDDSFFDCNGAEIGSDEHVSEVYIERETVEPGGEQTVICTFMPTKYWSIDRVYIYYYNGENWTKLLDGVAKHKYAYNETKTFSVGSKEGEKVVRCIISRDPVAGVCAKEGSYYDNDDLKFIVRKPLKCNVSCPKEEEFTRNKKLNCVYKCNKDVGLYYSFNLTEEVRPVQAMGNTFSLDFLDFPRGGKYSVNIFAADIFKEIIYKKDITLKSEAIISSLSVPEVVKKETEIICEAEDRYTGKKLDGERISFFVDGNLIGSSMIKDGTASVIYSSDEIGDKNISCSVKESQFYFESSKKSKVVYFSEFEGNIDVDELKEMEKKLEEIRNRYYKLSSHPNISESFSTNLTQIKNDLTELETYLKEGKMESFKEKFIKVENKIDSLQWETRINYIRGIVLNEYTLILFTAIFLVVLAHKYYQKRRKQKKLLHFYKNRERDLIEKRKQIEKDYFARKIDESYFNRLLLENYNKLSKVRAKIKELSQE